MELARLGLGAMGAQMAERLGEEHRAVEEAIDQMAQRGFDRDQFA